jgi:two-component system OmpR family response regulator
MCGAKVRAATKSCSLRPREKKPLRQVSRKTTAALRREPSSDLIAMNDAAAAISQPDASAARHICVVDDDSEIRALLSEYLSRHGMRVGTFEDGASLRRFLAHAQADLVILDVMLGAEDGLSICRRLKAETDLPVLMLTARGDEIDRVLGLELGADDYLCKPFSPRELLARIRNLLRLTEHRRHQSGTGMQRLSFNGWVMDTVRRQLMSAQGVPHRLSGSEYQLLHVLASNANRVLSRNELAQLVHGRELDSFDRSIDVLISRLRQVLGDSARDPQLIRTVYGRGYVLGSKVERE